MALSDEMLAHLDRSEQLVESLDTCGASKALVELQSGRTQLEELMKSANEQSEWEILARAAVVLGRLDYRLGPWSSAHILLRAAFTAASKPGVAVQVLGKAARHSTHIEGALGNLHRANVYAQLSLALARADGDRRVLTEALLGVAMVERNFGEYQPAQQLLEEARALIEPDDHSRRAALLNGMASIRERDGKLDEALALWREALEHAQAEGSASGEAYMRMCIGWPYPDCKQLDKAMESLQSAYSLAREIIHPYLVAATLNGMARAYHMQGNQAEAVAAALRAEFIYRALGSPLANGVYNSLLWVAGLSKDGSAPSSPEVGKPGWHRVL